MTAARIPGARTDPPAGGVSARATRRHPAAIAAAVALLGSGAEAGFSVSGPGGSIPDYVVGSAAWNSAPNWPVFTSSVSVPQTVTTITAVKFQGLQHTWRGDLHFYLTDPGGVRFNVIVRPGFTNPGSGDPGDYSPGNYTIVQSGGASLAQGAANIGGGTYDQFLNSGGGAWTSGTFVINNTPINAITGPAGTWTLTVADWAALDTGSLTGWTLEGVDYEFSSSGSGGAIPDYSGTATWNNPPDWPLFSSTATVANTVTSVGAVKILGLVHPARGNLHLFLTDPGGIRYNLIVRPGFTGTGSGDTGGYLSGGYTIVETGGANLQQGATSVNSGTYDQFVNTGGGQWTSGTLVIGNVPLSAITGPAGAWTLTMADWESGNVGSFSSWNLEGTDDLAPGSNFCFPGQLGTIACPCGNTPGSPSVGCSNSGSGGASLADAGTSSLAGDTVVFTASSMFSGSSCIFLQGDMLSSAGAAFGDGVRCTAGSLKRLYIKTITAGMATAPQIGDLSVSARSAALGDTILAGQVRYYQTYYRDPGVSGCFVGPGGATYNISPGRRMLWYP